MEAFGALADDEFHLVHQHERGAFIYDTGYLVLRRADGLVVVHIVAGNWRDTPKKRALFKAVTANLVRDVGLRPEDMLIVFSANGRDEWCFGNGAASSVTDEAS